MRIISKQRDYYDSAMGQGQDLRLCYLRQRRPQALPEPLRDALERGFRAGEIKVPGARFDLSPVVIAFCGKLYRGVKLRRFKGRRTSPQLDVTYDEIFYDWPSLEAACLLHDVELQEKPSKRRAPGPDRQSLAAWLGRQGSTECAAYLVEQKAVILTAQEINLYTGWFWKRTLTCVLDDDLGALGFGKIFAAYSAYQEIDMYLSGMLANDVQPPIALSEKDRVAQHGFDRWSFRRLPGHKRRA